MLPVPTEREASFNGAVGEAGRVRKIKALRRLLEPGAPHRGGFGTAGRRRNSVRKFQSSPTISPTSQYGSSYPQVIMVPTVSFTTATTSRSNSCRGMGLRGLFLEDRACYVCSHDWERTCLLSMGALQAPADLLQPHVSAGGRSNLKPPPARRNCRGAGTVGQPCQKQPPGLELWVVCTEETGMVSP